MTATAASSLDIICITESWLHSLIRDGEVIDNTYTIYRNDRDPTLSGQERGGGVFIAIKRRIHADLIPIDDCNLELVFVKIKGTVSDIIVGCVYMPPLTSYEEYHSLLTTLTHVNEKFINAKLLLVGDFNLPSSVPRADCDKSVHDGLALLECTQINSLCNYNNNLLDLCFCNVEASIDKALPFVPEDKYHPGFTVYLEFQPNLTPLSPATYSFKKADYHNLNTFYRQVNWIELYEIDTVENKVKWFYSKLEEGISRYVPVHRNFVSTYPCWFSYELINKIKLKKFVHSQYKKMKNQQNYTRFSILRRNCKILSAECYRNYVDKIENMVQTDPNAFWKFIKDKKHGNTDIPSSMSWINQSASTGQDISNLFASFFKTTFSSDHNSNHHINANANVLKANLNSLEVNYDDVLKQLLKLNPNKGAGPDGIPNLFLKNCATEICEPLTHIFNKSLQSGTFPSVWKLSYVCPIHKNGQRSEVSNYRPICIQSALAKLFEKLVLTQLTQAFKNIITTKQHGFVGGRSTTSNLYSYTNYLLNALNDGLKVHSIYTDFSKAFDRVNHTVLIAKLNNYGVEGTALEWLHSYLADRFLQVRVDGYLSEEYVATSGVPQGSHLGPLLFNIFINDIVNNIQSECLLYADDLKIYRTISNDSDIRLLQKDIDMLSTWCTNNKLDLNAKKCAAVSYSRAHNNIITSYKLNG